MERASIRSEKVAVTSAAGSTPVAFGLGTVLMTVGGPGTGSVGVVPSGSQLTSLPESGVVPSSATNCQS